MRCRGKSTIQSKQLKICTVDISGSEAWRLQETLRKIQLHLLWEGEHCVCTSSRSQCTSALLMYFTLAIMRADTNMFSHYKCTKWPPPVWSDSRKYYCSLCNFKNTIFCASPKTKSLSYTWMITISMFKLV